MGDEHTQSSTKAKHKLKSVLGCSYFMVEKVPPTEKTPPLEASNKMHLLAGHWREGILHNLLEILKYQLNFNEVSTVPYTYILKQI